MFIIKLYARINILKTLKTHGQDIYKLSKTLENQFSKIQKIMSDISFIEPCKKENITVTFAKVNVAVRHGIYTFKKKIRNTLMVTVLKNKDRERGKLKKRFHQTNFKLN